MNITSTAIKKIILVTSLTCISSIMQPSAWASDQIEDPTDQEGGTIIDSAQPPNSGGVNNTGDDGSNPPNCQPNYTYMSAIGMCVKPDLEP